MKSIIVNVLTALYTPFWFAVLLSILVMFFIMNAEEHGYKELFRKWIRCFKTDNIFRITFAFAFYTVMILFQTLMNRHMYTNPVTNNIGVWGLFTEKNGEMVLTTEVPENLVLFIPFSVLLLCRFGNKLLGDKVTLLHALWQSTKIVFLCSFTIEMLQLFLRLGTWQLSDLFFNTLGGFMVD